MRTGEGVVKLSWLKPVGLGETGSREKQDKKQLQA
jgi:hypothetical protein